MRGSSVEDEFDKGLFKFIPRLGVLFTFVGPANFINLSENCLITVRNVSVAKNCQKTVRNVSDMCRKTVRFRNMYEFCQIRIGNVSEMCQNQKLCQKTVSVRFINVSEICPI